MESHICRASGTPAAILKAVERIAAQRGMNVPDGQFQAKGVSSSAPGQHVALMAVLVIRGGDATLVRHAARLAARSAWRTGESRFCEFRKERPDPIFCAE